MLVVFAGLPGTGKSTIAHRLARRLRAVLVRIDAVEQAMRDGGVRDVGPCGYLVAYRLAAANLTLGHTVVADCVNPVSESRAAWRAVAAEAGHRILDVEVTCSDAVEHRHCIETRTADIPNLVLPTWLQVLAHEYATWTTPRLQIDTSRIGAEQAVAMIAENIATA